VAPITDGRRAVVAEDFTFANVAQVAAEFWKSDVSNSQSEIFGRELKTAAGYVRRFFSDRFAQMGADHQHQRIERHRRPPLQLEAQRLGRRVLAAVRRLQVLFDATDPAGAASCSA
jgi:hypothetical protein